MGAERHELVEHFLFGLFSQQSGAWQLKRKALYGILVRNTHSGEDWKLPEQQSYGVTRLFGLSLVADSLNAPFRVQERT